MFHFCKKKLFLESKYSLNCAHGRESASGAFVREAVGVRAGEFSRFSLIFLFHFRKKNLCESKFSFNCALDCGDGCGTSH